MPAADSYKKFLTLFQFVEDSQKLAFTKAYLEQIESPEEREEVSQLIDLVYAGLPAPPKKFLVLIHGIRTQGKWFDLLEAEIKKAGDFEVRHCKYAFFDLVRFWLPIPFLFRSGPIKKVRHTINTILGNNPGAELCVVAHSNGTYILSKILEKNPQINFKKIILCGSIVDENHQWSSIKEQNKNLFINDCGSQDILPVLAKTSTFGYGASGRLGFNNAEITNRYHNCGHSGFFTKEFFQKYWIPFFLEGKVELSDWQTEGGRDEKWCVQVLGLFPGLLLIITTTIAISFVIRRFI